MPLAHFFLRGPEKEGLLLKKEEDFVIYFAGIGGVGMEGLARLSKDLGYTVMGCDKDPAACFRLQRAGISATLPPHFLPEKTAFLVYTLALSEDDPLLLEARDKGIPAVSRAVYLGLLSENFEKKIAIAGTHGKSTVTAMVSACFSAAGLAPTVLSGAPLSENGSVYLQGSRAILLTEACEYRDSFLYFRPNVAVVLNAEWDHPDYFPTLSAVERSFQRFLSLGSVQRTVGGDGIAAAERFSLQDRTAAVYPDRVSYKNGCAVFSPVFRGKTQPEIALSVPGEHNLLNALAALAIVLPEGVPYRVARTALSAFSGAGRRMERRGCFHGAAVYSDYAHHPTAIRYALKTARSMTKGRLFVLFQSHTYSRTAALYRDFLEALSGADVLLIADIFSAREEASLGQSGKKMARDAGGMYIESRGAALRFLEEAVKKGDMVLVLGAGDLCRLIDEMPLEKEK